MYIDNINPNLLLDQEATLANTRDLLSVTFPDQNFYTQFLSKSRQADLKALRDLFKSMWEANVSVIFQYCESPIEKIFLNALNLCSIEMRFNLIFTKPFRSVYKDMEFIRSNFLNSMKVWDTFQKETGSEDLWRFFDYLEKSGLSVYEQLNIRHNVLIYRYVIDYFHISIQSVFENMGHRGKNLRPDIFIWIPAIERFGMIVECDGFQYHSDRQTFTSDRERDRIFQARGLQVLRFSGDEINNNCIAKAKELLDYLVVKEAIFFRNDKGIVIENGQVDESGDMRLLL